jgi:hypothetical protein
MSRILILVFLAFTTKVAAQVSVPDFTANATHADSQQFKAAMELTKYDDISIVLYCIPELNTNNNYKYYILGCSPKGHWRKTEISTPYSPQDSIADPNIVVKTNFKNDPKAYKNTWKELQENHLLTMKSYPRDSVISILDHDTISLQNRYIFAIKTKKKMRVYPPEYLPIGILPREYQHCVDIFLKHWTVGGN